MSKIKAVVFDLDGVFFRCGTEKFIEALVSKYNLSKDEIVAVYLKSEQMQLFKKGLIDSTAFWEYAINTWGITATREELIELLIGSYEVDTQTKEFIVELKNKSVKLAICTNNFPDRLENLIKKFGLEKYFDVIVSSYETGFTKPSKEIFDVLAASLNLSPNEILMSDDRVDNVAALNRFGFVGMLYEGWEEFRERVDKLSDNLNS